MAINAESWLKRAAEFRAHGNSITSGETLQFAISVACAFYGPASQQVEMIKTRAADIPKQKSGAYPEILIHEFSYGVIQNMVAEINAGLVQNIRLGIAGEILGDLIFMAREALGEKAVQVAAVLTAAAFEDLMRRLAQEKAGITTRIKLDQISMELKDRGILQGGEPGAAQSFLKFRNDSLHADWNNVKEPQVTSCLGLLDSLIVKHFG